MLTMIDKVAGRPWGIRAEVAGHVRALLMRDGIGALRELAGLKAHIHSDSIEAARGGRRSAISSTVGVVPVIGTLTLRQEMIDSEMTRSTQGVADEVAELAADPKIDAVVMEVDSPGGEVFGVPEAWTTIREAAKGKPVVAAVNATAASAAYYLASAATEVWLTPSGEVGSIGVFALHVDASQALEGMGESWEFVEADDSPYKVELAPDRPLSEDARGELRRTVNRYMGYFVRDVARGRGVGVEVVRRDFGRGRMVGAERAKEARMVDHIGTLDAAIRRAAHLGRQKRQGAGLAADGFPAGVDAEAFNAAVVSALRAAGGLSIAPDPAPAAEATTSEPDPEEREDDVLERIRSL